MPHRCLKTVLAAALSAAACSQPSLAQSPASTILLIDLENSVQYNEDISDPSRFATDPNVTTVAATRNFTNRTTMGDIVVVNGRAAKGTQLSERRIVSLSTSPAPGQAIADTIRNSIAIQSFEILQGDGTPIGSIFLSGLADSGAQPNKPPGAPSDQIMSNWAIVGGTGAFLGARGQAGEGTSPQPNGPPRQASYSEDPANRRRNGGSRTRWVLHVIPMLRPEIAATATGPAIFHDDFSPVTAAKPAKAGEVLIIKATGLGPTRPGVDPGHSFPTDTFQKVNSPVDVMVNGQSAEVINKIGWPGLIDTYRVDFRVPDGATGGTAGVQLTAAWIASTSVNISIQ